MSNLELRLCVCVELSSLQPTSLTCQCHSHRGGLCWAQLGPV